jgi:hypothetical protein
MDVPDGRSHPLATSQRNLSLPVWSQDFQWIFASDGRATLYRVPASGGAAEQFTHKRAYRAAVGGVQVIFNVASAAGIELWSRRWLVYTRSADWQGDIMMISGH